MKYRIALITGGSRGLGRSMALQLARKGIDSVLTYHSNREAAEEVVAQIKQLGRHAVALPLDTANSQSFAAFAQTLKDTVQQTWQHAHIDYLVNNAGVGAYASISETTEAQVDMMMTVHFKGVFMLTQHLLPLIADGGRILNVSSGVTRFTVPGYAAYASMKGAVEVYTRYLAKELGPRGITVNCLAPGAIETDFGGGAARDNKQLNQQLASNTALGRVGLPDDIGGVVAELLAGDNHWLTAQRIEVSGGMFL